MNNVISRQIKERDYLIKIVGKDRLDNQELYLEDGVHLKPIGVKMYMNMIEGTFAYIIGLNDRQSTDYLKLKKREENYGESSKKGKY